MIREMSLWTRDWDRSSRGSRADLGRDAADQVFRQIGEDDLPVVLRRLAALLAQLHDLSEFSKAGFLMNADDLASLRHAFSGLFQRNGQSEDPLEGLTTPPDPWRNVWCPRPDLLSSHARDRDFVMELDDEGRAQLRFGDGDLGSAPEPGRGFLVTYRVGNGTAGNVAAETIKTIRVKQDARGASPPETIGVRNPLPAVGGVDPEPTAEVKLFAPGAFRTPKRRAVTAEDYAALASVHPGVQRAAASFRWTGSGVEVQVAVDPLGTAAPATALLEAVERSLEPYRRIGHDVRVLPARYVPLDLQVEATVRPQYLRGHVEAALLRVFSSQVGPDGCPGLFHPDNLTFGSDVEVSRLVAAAQSCRGGPEHTRDPAEAPGRDALAGLAAGRRLESGAAGGSPAGQ